MSALNLNPEDLSIGDLEDFEEITGMQLQKALEAKPVIDPDTGKQVKDAKGRPLREVQISTKVLKALVFLTKRRENPEFTLKDARDVKVTELNFAEADEPGNG
jgi:hypothetical protein